MAMLVFAMLGVIALAAVQREPAAGHWEGSVNLPGHNLNILLDVSGRAAQLRGTLSILESRLEAFPVPRIGVEQGELSFEVPPGWGLAMFAGLGLKPEEEIITYRGRMTGSEIAGQLHLGTGTFPLVLHLGRASVPYREEGVTFSNGDVTLAGTLLIPSTAGPHPVVVFTHGSGATTRDAHRYEADLLVRRGIACLLYDKRGTGQSSGASWEWASFNELAGDAEKAVDFVAARRDIDARRIGLFGLSQGAWLSEIVAARSPNVAFLVVVAGGGIPAWQQELYYRANRMRDEGFGEGDVKSAVDFMRARFDAARTGLGWEQIDQAIKVFQEDKVRWFPSFTGNQNSMQTARLWWLLAFSYDPARDLQHITIPVLGIVAEDDRVMPTSDTINGLKQGLTAAGNPRVTIATIPGAYHSMTIRQELKGAGLRRVISPAYTSVLVQWVMSQTGN
jgi:pimeloyl-ACP methyl ester carboxylesterase